MVFKKQVRNWMKFLLSSISFVIIFNCVFLSCEKSFSPLGSEIVYAQSFESPNDFSDWDEFGAASMKKDAPPGGGTWSVQISGGCIVPHAYVDIEPLSYDCELVFSFWGKNLFNGGSVSLGSDDYKGDTQVAVTDKVWRYYISTVYNYKKGQPLRLSLYSGGYVPGAMLIDMIKIKLVD